MDVTVSILVLTYNRVALSNSYIPGIVNNAGDIPFEVLIWDNGSTDGSYDWVYEYGQADCRVYKTYGSELNIGMEAFNTMAQDARGKYIIKVDDDITVPKNFAERMVAAYEYVNDSRLLFLGWDMAWANPNHRGTATFATRSGRNMYEGALGKVLHLPTEGESVLVSYNPRKWMVNGVCRLSTREAFLGIGGHPKGIIYGVDVHVSRRAAECGYWVGYLHANDLVHHHGFVDSVSYRSMKDVEMRKRVSNYATSP
jgi:GT2 family glycosyltransferase